MLRLTAAVVVLLGALIAGVPQRAPPAQTGAVLSAATGIPGEQVTLTVSDAARIVDLLPLAVHLRVLPLLQDWPCDSPGSRILGFLEVRGDDASLTFTIPWVQPGTYRLMGVMADRTCVPLAEGPLEFTVSPDVPVRLPIPEIVTVGARYGPAVPGCGSWDVNGSQGVDDCGPYEYEPLDPDPIRLTPGAPVVLGISQNWHFGAWDLAAISEEGIVPGIDWPEGTVAIASGAGGTRTISARLPAAAGVWRLLLRYRAARGPHSVNMARPSVFRVRLALPDTATDIVTARNRAAPASTPAGAVVLSVGLVALIIVAVRRRRSSS